MTAEYRECHHEFTYPGESAPAWAITRCSACGVCLNDHELRELLWLAFAVASYPKLETAAKVVEGFRKP